MMDQACFKKASSDNALVYEKSICESRNQLSRKNCVVFLPKDSVAAKCRGMWKELEVQSYSYWNDQKKQLLAMERQGSFPKYLWLMLSSTLSHTDIEELKALCETSSKKHAVTFYICAELLPLNFSHLKIEMIKMQQKLLTDWQLHNQCKKVVIISSISACLWDLFPFITLFIVAKRETKELFEMAIFNIVDGRPFPMEAALPKQSAAIKRSAPASVWGGNAPLTSDRKYFCTNCMRIGHSTNRCMNT